VDIDGSTRRSLVSGRPPLDLAPSVRQLKSLLYGVTDEALAAPTPCSDWTVGDLLDHLTGLTRAYTQAAQKLAEVPGTSTAPSAPSGADLHPRWRSRLPAQLDDLATAWAAPGAWTGMAQAGGVTMPAVVMGVVVVNELTIHGWDLARATGQDFAADPRTLQALITYLSKGAEAGTGGILAGLDEGDEGPLLERAVILSGRDPAWRP
jgi:uncharacterized protein (TIGR03086 family)